MLVTRPNPVDQLVKTPTPVYGTEGRYAAALYSAASKNKALEAVEKDLKTMTATLGKDAQFAAFLADPSGKVHILRCGLIKLRIFPLNGHSPLPRCRSSNLRCSVDSPGKIH